MQNDKLFRVGIVCGSFDVIHPGYIKMFMDAKSVCDKVLIALQSDPSIERPHKEKPLQTPKEREFILRSIRYIDDVVHYTTEKDLYEILKTDIYDVRILGTDYKDADYTGKDLGDLFTGTQEITHIQQQNIKKELETYLKK